MNIRFAPARATRPVNQVVAKIASSAFWSLTHPLNRAYQRAYGKTIDGIHYPANGFSLRQLIEFAEELPPEILAAYAEEAASAAFWIQR